jgi:hypothetical protein
LDGVAHLEQRDDGLVVVAERVPLFDHRRHEEADEVGVVEALADRVGQRADRVVQDEKIFLLVLAEGKGEIADDRVEEGLEPGAGLLLERRKGRAAGLLDALVVVEHGLEEALHRRQEELGLGLGRRAGVDTPARVAAERPARDRPDERLHKGEPEGRIS